MVTSGATDTVWGDLANLPPPDREARMLQRYAELVELEEGERQRRLLAMARAEYALSEDKLRDFTMSRMRMFLKLPPETGKRMGAAYDAVMLQMPGPAAMRRVMLVQTLAKEFSPEDEARLRALNPNLFGGLPSRDAIKPTQPATAAAPAEKKKGWWPFGGK